MLLSKADKLTRQQQMLEEGEIGLVGAYYELASGRVHFSEPVLQAHGGTR